MTENNDREWLEVRYMLLYNLERGYPDDQLRIEEMEQMDDDALAAIVNEAQECNDYMAGSAFRKNFGLSLMGDLKSG